MRTLVIAEAGVNHNGELDTALGLIDAAAESGADVVKFQTFQADKLADRSAQKARYQALSGDSESQLEMLRRLELNLNWFGELLAHAKKRGIQMTSTAFDLDSLNFLSNLDLPFLKIPSGEVTNGPLILAFAATGQDLVLSTGMSRLGEVEQALATIAWGRVNPNRPSCSEELWDHWASLDSKLDAIGRVTLLHCTSQYPAPIESANLLAMQTLAATFGLPVGYSDHTEGEIVSLAAVAMGASMVEKHFTLDRNLPGPDHQASLEPMELSIMISNIRKIEASRGDPIKSPSLEERETRDVARQRVVASRKISKGDVFSEKNVTTLRSHSGRWPNEIWDLFDTKSQRDFEAGEGI